MFLTDAIEAEENDLYNVSCLKNVEGTVLLYICNTVRQNQALGKSLLKMLKVSEQNIGFELAPCKTVLKAKAFSCVMLFL